MEMRGQLHTLATLPQGNSPQYTWDRSLGEPQSQPEHIGEEKKNP